MDKCIKKLDFERNIEELHGEMQVTVNSIIADFNKEI